MPRITAQREADRRARILRAARAAFVEKGFHRASIDDVVAASGISVGAIYNYYPTKDELIRACIVGAVEVEAEAMLQDARAAATLSERLDRVLRDWWRFTIETEGGPAFLAEAWGEASRRPAIRELMAHRAARGTAMIATMVRECVERGELPAGIDPDALAATFAALTDGMVLEHVVSGGALRFDEARRRADLVLRAALQAPG